MVSHHFPRIVQFQGDPPEGDSRLAREPLEPLEPLARAAGEGRPYLGNF